MKLKFSQKNVKIQKIFNLITLVKQTDSKSSIYVTWVLKKKSVLKKSVLKMVINWPILMLQKWFHNKVSSLINKKWIGIGFKS